MEITISSVAQFVEDLMQHLYVTSLLKEEPFYMSWCNKIACMCKAFRMWNSGMFTFIIFCQKTMTVIYISWRWKYHCQTRRVTCTISTRPAVLTLKLVSRHALNETTLYLLLDLADILWGGLRDDPKEGLCLRLQVFLRVQLKPTGRITVSRNLPLYNQWYNHLY